MKLDEHPYYSPLEVKFKFSTSICAEVLTREFLPGVASDPVKE